MNPEGAWQELDDKWCDVQSAWEQGGVLEQHCEGIKAPTGGKYGISKVGKIRNPTLLGNLPQKGIPKLKKGILLKVYWGQIKYGCYETDLLFHM